jgi:hypothetical protein
MSPEEREIRTNLVDAEILLDAINLNPTKHDLRVQSLERHIARLRQRVAAIHEEATS